MKTYKIFFFILAYCITALSCKENNTKSESKSDPTYVSKNHAFDFDADNIIAPIQPTMYGIFFEDINFGADGGLYPELIKNRNFEFDNPMLGWLQPNSDRHSLNLESGMGTIVKIADSGSNRNYLHVDVNNDQKYLLTNEGFRGMGIHKGAKYSVKISCNNLEGKITKVIFNVVDTTGKSLGNCFISPKGGWSNYTATIEANSTFEKAKLNITFEGKGSIDIDKLSLYPQDNWGKRPNGLRKDIVQLLYDLKPGFLRFPGGCIVEGRTLAQRYQWKKTVGPLDQRETLINRWNTEFGHRLTPDYFQSFGLGFYEYFQLAEDIGAEPLPILNCGMACQFNTGELVPITELDPYVQDALDLIEFANGNVNTKWGRVRNSMGHAQPFNLKFIGVGNEQWGPEYFKRYSIFEKAIKSKYPDIKIVSGSGPFPDGEHFDYGMQELKKYNEYLIDEHYYRPPAWFRENANRYDSYDRKGPKIFAGEYAAQSVAIASTENKNNWDCALSEAAFMTGLERNAEVVHMTSYAPLMAHSEGWQWTPDLIWFNNLNSYGTPNYYVQKMFSNNKGTHVLKLTENNKPIIGANQVYATAAKDSISNAYIFKLVNTSDKIQSITIHNIKGKGIATTGQLETMAQINNNEVNSFENEKNISPFVKSLEISNDKELVLALEPKSLSILKININR
jgi:alpha-L-arabinofuranosidase